MAMALHLHSRGIPADESKRRIAVFRDSLRATGSPGYLQALSVAVGAGTLTGVGNFIGNLTGSESIKVGLRTAMGVAGMGVVNAWFEGNDDAVAFTDLDEAFDDVIERYVATYKESETFRETADEMIVPEYGFSPNSDMQTIRSASPNYANLVDTSRVLEIVGDQEQLLREYDTRLGVVHAGSGNHRRHAG